MADRSSEMNLTGIWQGEYRYAGVALSVAFSATLIESGAFVSGSTHETCRFGPTRGEMLFASIIGSRSGANVSFTKTYDGAPEGYGTVQYRGGINSDGTEIAGYWSIAPHGTGSFVMRRNRAKAKARSRRASAKV